MSFQDNKFPIMLGAATAVVAGGLIFWGISSGGKYAAAKDQYSTTASEIDELGRIKPSPNADNADAKKKAVTEYRANVEELQGAFDSFRKPQLEDVAGDVFTDRLLEAKKTLLAAFEDAEAEVPDGFLAGVERYTEEPPRRKATGVLLYQLDAFTELLTLLAKARPAEVINVYRPETPEESGKEFEAGGDPYRAHAIELSFKGRESALRDFLGALDDSENFYYVVRSLRIRNEDQDSPNAKDADFEAPAAAAETGNAADDIFAAGGFDFVDDGGDFGSEDVDAAGDEEPAEAVEEQPAAAATDTGEILKQVLGDELIEVFMRIDVLQFLEPAELPK